MEVKRDKNPKPGCDHPLFRRRTWEPRVYNPLGGKIPNPVLGAWKEVLFIEPIICVLPVGVLQANCYLVVCAQTRLAVVIDPGDEPGRILQEAQAVKATISLILATHGHFDHVLGVGGLKRLTGAPFRMPKGEWETYGKQAYELGVSLGLPAAEPVPPPDRFIQEGDRFTVGTLCFQTLGVPGHAPDHVAFLLEGQPPRLFCGDAIFAGSIGRTDIPLADHATLLHSIETRILSLPDETILYPGHGAATTVGTERETNPYL